MGQGPNMHVDDKSSYQHVQKETRKLDHYMHFFFEKWIITCMSYVYVHELTIFLAYWIDGINPYWACTDDVRAGHGPAPAGRDEDSRREAFPLAVNK